MLHACVRAAFKSSDTSMFTFIDRGGINLATHMRPFSAIDQHLAAEGDPGGLPDHNGNLCVRTHACVGWTGLSEVAFTAHVPWLGFG